jgi:predicted house-cleaning noncanonical NTP pyrophosphatase (MazG superfamily)
MSTELKLRSYGYAPGNYLCICRVETCQEPFQGEKRAYRCKACAMAQHEAAVLKEADRLDLGQDVRMPQIVRDKMVPREGILEENHRVSEALAIALLIGKLHDEVAELGRDLRQPDEYGDVLDILETLMAKNGITAAAVTEARARKNATKGGFAQNNLWIPGPFVEAKDDRAAA